MPLITENPLSLDPEPEDRRDFFPNTAKVEYQIHDGGVLRTGPATSKVYNWIEQRCPVIVGAPTVVFIGAGEWSVTFGAHALCLAIPARVWLGLEEASDVEPCSYQLGLHYVYWQTLQEFRWRQYPSEKELSNTATVMWHRKTADYFHEVLENLEIKNGFRIHLVSEVHPKSGAGWSGAFAAALTTALGLWSGKLSGNDIANWRRLPGSPGKEPISANQHDFAFWNRIAWGFEAHFQRGVASGYGNCVSLVSNGSLIEYWNDAESPEDTKLNDSGSPFYATLGFNWSRVTVNPKLAIAVMGLSYQIGKIVR